MSAPRRFQHPERLSRDIRMERRHDAVHDVGTIKLRDRLAQRSVFLRDFLDSQTLLSPSDPSFLLNERRFLSVQVGALNIDLSRQNANVLPERLLFDPRSQAFDGVVPRHLERQPLTRKAPSTATIWKPWRLDQLPQQPCWPKRKNSLFELRHRVAAGPFEAEIGQDAIQDDPFCARRNEERHRHVRVRSKTM